MILIERKTIPQKLVKRKVFKVLFPFIEIKRNVHVNYQLDSSSTSVEKLGEARKAPEGQQGNSTSFVLILTLMFKLQLTKATVSQFLRKQKIVGLTKTNTIFRT